jgi:hypothetical protein
MQRGDELDRAKREEAKIARRLDRDRRRTEAFRRYGLENIEAKLFKRERPGGRMLLVDRDKHCDHPIVLTEFGGIAFSRNNDDIWGYSRSTTPAELSAQYRELLKTVRGLPGLAGFCYTQFADTYQEANGLLYADRTPKVPFDELSEATTGLLPDYDTHSETIWREHLMGSLI